MYGLLLVKKQDFVEQPFYQCMAFKKTKKFKIYPQAATTRTLI